jgi:catalase
MMCQFAPRMRTLCFSIAASSLLGAAPLAAQSTPQQAGAPRSSVVDAPSGQQMVDALHTAFGDHRARAVHAKGVMAMGDFTPAPSAVAMSKAVLFRGGTIPVLVRFSDFTGIPDIPDNIGAANPRGLALKFTLPNGATTDIVAHSFNGFPSATSEEFRQLLIAIGTSGSDTPKPTPLDAFLAAHPVTKTFLTTQKPAPTSYASLQYFGVNTFRFTNGSGRQRLVRYRFLPVAGEAFVPASELAAKSADYLVAELPGHLARGAVDYEWYAQIAERGDNTDDPSTAWPESRALVKLGTIRVRSTVADPATTDRATMFIPTNVPAGIEPADAMLRVRQQAYPLSFTHRQ